MAIITTASNNNFGKWVPYYHKPFNLGSTGRGGEDGVVHITQTTGSSDSKIEAQCLSETNCGFWYELLFTHAASADKFQVRKYDLNDNLIDTINASETGLSDDGRYWRSSTIGAFSIDEGVMVGLYSTTDFITDDVYKITMPTVAQMERKRVYHGGYSTFMRMPYTEGVAYHSDIIPCNLLGKNITALFNNVSGIGTNSDKAYCVLISQEDIAGNTAVSLYLEWNVDKDSATSSTAGGTVGVSYTWGAGETWQLGTVLIDDADPGGATGADFPIVAQLPASDVSESSSITGTTQVLNATVSGRAGYAKIRCSYDAGAGDSKVLAHNQYWPLILMIS